MLSKLSSSTSANSVLTTWTGTRKDVHVVNTRNVSRNQSFEMKGVIMPGPITHLVIANEILKKISVSDNSKVTEFLAGALAPDAIHARKGFRREDKKRTHLRQNIPDVEFHHDNNLKVFNNRISDFVYEYLSDDEERFWLHLGYLVHLLTDESLMMTIRQEFTSEVIKEGIEPSDREFFLRIMHDLDSNDNNLYVKYKGISFVDCKLRKFESEGIKGLLSAEELNNSRKWVFANYFKDERIEEPKYITYERFAKFIDMTVENIVRRLLTLDLISEINLSV